MAGQLQQAVMEQTLFHVAKQLESQLDQELHKLDNIQGDDIEQLRQRRIFEMKKQQERTQEWLEKGHGEYRELGDEKEFFKEMKGEERMVCHFYRNNWPCKVGRGAGAGMPCNAAAHAGLALYITACSAHSQCDPQA